MIELIGLAGSLSILSGWRLYFTVLATGLAMRVGWIALPENLAFLDALANPWVIGIAAIGTIAEFFADKIAVVDSIWDTIHSVVRPLGGALLALAVVDASDPAWQIVALLLGGGAAALGHGAKATTRAAVNASPEPYSNIAVSTGEDIATVGLTGLALAFPVLALVIAVMMLASALLVIVTIRRFMRRIRARLQGAGETGTIDADSVSVTVEPVEDRPA